MIVVAEGPTAAGKTTWCRRHARQFVDEYTPTGTEPDASCTNHWVSVNTNRWTQALVLERTSGLAVCDGDPLKLHYSWCLARIGVAPIERFERELGAVRKAFLDNSLGFADLVLVSIPTPGQLRERRRGEQTRRRHSFELHARLADPLSEWYHAVDTLEPGRVIWELPPSGLPIPLPLPRTNRCDTALLDAVIASLPSR